MKIQNLAITVSALILAPTLGPGPIGAAESAVDAVKAPTFSKDVLPILQTRCQECHRVGGEGIAGVYAPMSLMTFDEVRPWAKSIARNVQARQMPPWDATDETLGQFANERVMTDSERDILVEWAKTGAKRGRPDDAPPPRTFEDKKGWLLGEPDLVVPLPEPYWVSDDLTDHQPRIVFKVTEEMLPEARWISAIEIRPDAPQVHHAVGRATAPPWGEHPEETFSAGSIAAGEDPIVYPTGFGNLLRPGTEISVSMHYFKEAGAGTGFFDRTEIGFHFHNTEADVQYKVSRGGIGSSGWEIPPGHPNWRIGGSRVFEEDTVLISLHPHMHFRGKSMLYTALYPDGTTEVLLNVPEYDYGLQTQYTYREPKFIPKGTRIEVESYYDNSESIKAKFPLLDIERAVHPGSRSVDEMFIPFIEWSEIDTKDVEKFRASSPTTGAGR